MTLAHVAHTSCVAAYEEDLSLANYTQIAPAGRQTQAAVVISPVAVHAPPGAAKVPETQSALGPQSELLKHLSGRAKIAESALSLRA